MTRQTGETSWGTGVEENQEETSAPRKLPFLNMAQYDSSWTVRITDQMPSTYYCHWTKNKDGRNVKVNCSLDKDCPVVVEDRKTGQTSVCAGNKPQKRFYIRVLYNNEMKVLDIGWQIFTAISDLVKNPSWGPTSGYDIQIKKGARGANPLYTVMALPKSELTSEQQQIVDAAYDLENQETGIDLTTKVQALDADSIRRILGMAVDQQIVKKQEESFSDDIDWGAD